MKITRQISETFQVTNLLATVMVIAIHYNTKRHIPVADPVDLNFWIQEFLTNGVARMAVPFFALSAGLFFFLNYKGSENYIPNLKKRYSSILIPYLLACSFIFFANYLDFGIWKGQPYPITPAILLNDIVLHPQSVQFWFLRDLIVLCVMSPVLFLVITRMGELYMALLALLWLTDTEALPLIAERELIAIETLFFFSVGAYLSIKKVNFESVLADKSMPFILSVGVAFFVLIGVRIQLDPYSSFRQAGDYFSMSLALYKVAIIAGLYWTLIVSYRLRFSKLIYLSSFTYFAFLYHLMPLSKFVTKSATYIVDDSHQFYLAFPVATISVFLIAILLNRYIERVYALLTGNRTPDKVLSRTSNTI